MGSDDVIANAIALIDTEEFLVDPHPAYARMRDAAPVHRVRDPSGLEFWLVTRYEEARAALTDARLSKDPRRAWESLRNAGRISGRPEDTQLNMLLRDPPNHTRLRGLVVDTLTPMVERLQPRLPAIADDVADAMAARDRNDILDDFAFPLSIAVIGELLGVPPDERGDFRAWTTAALTPAYVRGRPMSRQDAGRRQHDYVEDLIARRRAAGAGDDPRADLVEALLAGEREGRLTAPEVAATVRHLLFIGHEAATDLIGNSVAALLCHRDQLDVLRGRPDRLPAAIEELLRFDGPTARTSPRFATEEILLGGAVIPEGGIVVIALAAANRDPRRFADPDRLDVTRDADGHLAFGRGIHASIGAPLARLEGSIAIGTLLRRFPGIALGCAPQDLRWRPSPVFRGLDALPVTLRPVVPITRPVDPGVPAARVRDVGECR
jgi:cytochrome P450